MARASRLPPKGTPGHFGTISNYFPADHKRTVETIDYLVLIGLGANLPGADGRSPRDTCQAALDALADAGVGVARRSRWYASAPQPPSDQPWFVNAVAALDTDLDAISLLRLLLAVERQFGRERRQRWAARVLDLDLLCHGRAVIDDADGGLVLPHPRLHDRAFVLAPLAEIAPGWRHPVSGRTATALLAACPSDQIARPLP